MVELRQCFKQHGFVELCTLLKGMVSASNPKNLQNQKLSKLLHRMKNSLDEISYYVDDDKAKLDILKSEIDYYEQLTKGLDFKNLHDDPGTYYALLETFGIIATMLKRCGKSGVLITLLTNEFKNDKKLLKRIFPTRNDIFHSFQFKDFEVIGEFLQEFLNFLPEMKKFLTSLKIEDLQLSHLSSEAKQFTQNYLSTQAQNADFLPNQQQIPYSYNPYYYSSYNPPYMPNPQPMIYYWGPQMGMPPYTQPMVQQPTATPSFFYPTVPFSHNKNTLFQEPPTHTNSQNSQQTLQTILKQERESGKGEENNPLPEGKEKKM